MCVCKCADVVQLNPAYNGFPEPHLLHTCSTKFDLICNILNKQLLFLSFLILQAKGLILWGKCKRTCGPFIPISAHHVSQTSTTLSFFFSTVFLLGCCCFLGGILKTSPPLYLSQQHTSHGTRELHYLSNHAFIIRTTPTTWWVSKNASLRILSPETYIKTARDPIAQLKKMVNFAGEEATDSGLL